MSKCSAKLYGTWILPLCNYDFFWVFVLKNYAVRILCSCNYDLLWMCILQSSWNSGYVYVFSIICLWWFILCLFDVRAMEFITFKFFVQIWMCFTVFLSCILVIVAVSNIRILDFTPFLLLLPSRDWRYLSCIFFVGSL